MPRFLKPLTVLLVVLAAASTFGVAKAQASSCSQALIRDWYVDGRIDQTYQVHCYREALKDIPEDQIVYGTLRDDLTRALQQVIRDKGGPGNVDPTTPVPPGAGSGPGTGSGAGSSHDESFFGKLARALGPDTADSIPVPLLVLGGLALLLIAAAGVSFLARRMQARRAAADPPPAPPLA
jgi:hypothetical protein